MFLLVGLLPKIYPFPMFIFNFESRLLYPSFPRLSLPFFQSPFPPPFPYPLPYSSTGFLPLFSSIFSISLLTAPPNPSSAPPLPAAIHSFLLSHSFCPLPLSSFPLSSSFFAFSPSFSLPYSPSFPPSFHPHLVLQLSSFLPFPPPSFPILPFFPTSPSFSSLTSPFLLFLPSLPSSLPSSPTPLIPLF